MSCRLGSAYRVSPATNSCATCRLNSMLCERCLAMAFILRKPSPPCQFTNLNLSGPRGALHCAVISDMTFSPYKTTTTSEEPQQDSYSLRLHSRTLSTCMQYETR